MTTFYTPILDGVPGQSIRSQMVEAEFALIAAAFNLVDTTKLDVGAQGTVAINRRAITTTDTVVASDRGRVLACSGTFTLSITAAATLGNGFWFILRNLGTGNITVDPNASETIDGVTTGTLFPGFSFLVNCDGTAFYVTKLEGMRREVLTSGTSWTCPMGIRRVRGRGVGGGGGGGRFNGGNIAIAGAAGAYGEWEFASSAGTAYAYAIGSAGSGASALSGSGGNGGVTSFNTGVVTVQLDGGSGGDGINIAGQSLGGSATNADVGVQGQSGYNNAGSIGGNTPLGAGGRQINNTVPASGFGSGGFGGNFSSNGGAGRPGAIILEY